MEAAFDNQTNILSAQIRSVHDNSVLYRVVTDETIWGRTRTYIKDANPARGEPPIVGVIHWKNRTFEIHGQKRPLSEVRRKPAGFTNKERFWKWSAERREYSITYCDESEWRAKLLDEVAATFNVPFRPKLFGKLKPMVVNLSRKALEKDEVFILLVFIYCEVKRQEKMNASGGW